MASRVGFAFSIRDGDRWRGRYRRPVGVGDHLALLLTMVIARNEL
jgi:hypothetical protein